MNNKKANAVAKKNMSANRTVVSSIDKENNWTGSVIGASGGERRVTVNSLSGLFSRSKKFSVVVKKA